MIGILVGPEQKAFRVHKNLLCTKVPYFQKILNGGFKEATEQVAKLPYDDPAAFGLFLEWLYVGRLPPIPPFSVDKWKWSHLIFERVKLYCFAENIASPKLMDYTMTTLISGYLQNNTLPSFGQIKLAYRNSLSTSRLRKFMSQSVHYICTSPMCSAEIWSNKEICEFLIGNKEGATDLVESMRESSGEVTPDPRCMALCTFHVHPENEECEFKNVSF